MSLALVSGAVRHLNRVGRCHPGMRASSDLIQPHQYRVGGGGRLQTVTADWRKRNLLVLRAVNGYIAGYGWLLVSKIARNNTVAELWLLYL